MYIYFRSVHLRSEHITSISDPNARQNMSGEKWHEVHLSLLNGEKLTFKFETEDDAKLETTELLRTLNLLAKP